MNKHIKEYMRLRFNGYGDIKAFGAVAGNIAVAGTFKDLEVLYSYHMDDFLNDCSKTFNEAEEVKNERITG